VFHVVTATVTFAGSFAVQVFQTIDNCRVTIFFFEFGSNVIAKVERSATSIIIFVFGVFVAVERKSVEASRIGIWWTVSHTVFTKSFLVIKGSAALAVTIYSSTVITDSFGTSVTTFNIFC